MVNNIRKVSRANKYHRTKLLSISSLEFNYWNCARMDSKHGWRDNILLPPETSKLLIKLNFFKNYHILLPNRNSLRSLHQGTERRKYHGREHIIPQVFRALTIVPITRRDAQLSSRLLADSHSTLTGVEQITWFRKGQQMGCWPLAISDFPHLVPVCPPRPATTYNHPALSARSPSTPIVSWEIDCYA